MPVSPGDAFEAFDRWAERAHATFLRFRFVTLPLGPGRAPSIGVVETREIVAEFHGMIQRRAAVELSSWIQRARVSLVASFARGVTNDEASVRAAIILPWSNTRTEGQITSLKLVRRQMYGRGKIDLLEARAIGAQ